MHTSAPLLYPKCMNRAPLSILGKPSAIIIVVGLQLIFELYASAVYSVFNRVDVLLLLLVFYKIKFIIIIILVALVVKKKKLQCKRHKNNYYNNNYTRIIIRTIYMHTTHRHTIYHCALSVGRPSCKCHGVRFRDWKLETRSGVAPIGHDRLIICLR